MEIYGLSKYASILLNKSIFFCKSSIMGDPYEGMLTTADYNHIKSMLGDDRDDGNALRRWAKNPLDRYVVSCWHIADYESAAMWSLYGLRGQSIAITARFSDLVDQMPPFVKCGPVNYVDFATDGCYFRENKGTDIRILTKRREFRHEAEYRFFFNAVGYLGQSFHRHCSQPKDGSGFYVKITPCQAIKGVFTDPFAPQWFADLVHEFSEVNGLQCGVKQSCLMSEPNYDPVEIEEQVNSDR